ncbi:hypothetical protein AC579_9859 [Pseudocercospora musae]|uniref:Uncharacterized protein n=1 Tax=Pseudocercospora musae TaxID=113226 RepID=A0A139I826_9PEZI|nr:hypothetical protein AC579_9859 [Pseudocercospora musae]
MHEPRSDSSFGSVKWKRSSAGSFQLVVSSDEVDDDAAPDEQKRCTWLGRVDSYSRLMHAHTMYQMEGKTLPGYNKTLHAYTQNQLDLHRTAPKSVTSSPHLGARHGGLPSPICARLRQLTIDDAPIPPANSPSAEQRHAHRPPSTRGLKPRSATEPIPRRFAQAHSVSSVACA